MKRIFKQFNLIKTNNLSPLIIEHKKNLHHINNSTNDQKNQQLNNFLLNISEYKKDFIIWHLKSRSWFGTGTKMWQG